MKFQYAYKTSDGVRHVEEMEAPSREAVFAELRSRGIKAIKVIAMDGSKANGEVRVIGVRKRVAAGLVVGASVIAAVVGALVMNLREDSTSGADGAASREGADKPAVRRVASPLPRQMIPGSRQRIENTPTNLFNSSAEMYLAKFAEPGRDFDGIYATGLAANDAELMKILSAPIYYFDDEFTEHIDLKRITAGIKREMRSYLADGGTAQEYLSELVKRQRLEISYRTNAEKKLNQLLKAKVPDHEAAYEYLLKANAQLQSMGIYPIAIPDALRSYQMSFDINEQ